MTRKPPSIRHAQRLRRARSPWPLRYCLLACAWLHTGLLAAALHAPASNPLPATSQVSVARWIPLPEAPEPTQFVEAIQRPEVPTQPTPVTAVVDQDATPSRDHVSQPSSAQAGGEGVEAPATTDPVAQFRQALGWAPVDRSQLIRKDADALVDSQVTPPDAPLTYVPAIRAHGTPLGDYMARVERQIADRWMRTDLGVHPKGVGIQGQVTVRYGIRSNGRTQSVRIASSSGVPELDRMALHAIPRQLPRIPASLNRDAIEHQIVLRYRNPLLSDHASAARPATAGARARP